MIMKTSAAVIVSLVALLACAPQKAAAQFPEDALRLSFPGLGVGARTLGMGTAYTGVANDFSATYWNPAGLGQMRLNEISLGLDYVSYGNTSSYFGSGQSFTNSGTNLNSLGMVYAVPTSRGSLVFSLGYGRQTDFTTGLSFLGFNPQSSIIQSWAPDGGTTNNPSGNLAYELYLANADSVGPNLYRWDSKILNNVTQSGKVLEGGGLNNVSVAAAVEAARNLFLGASLNFITGSYSYTRNYYEDDLKNLYTVLPFDFSSLSLLETVQSDLSGFSAKLGLLYKFGPGSRLGVAVKTPSWVTVRETYSQSGSSKFDNGDRFSFTTADQVQNEYDVVTPFVFSVGLSHSIQNLMLAADLDYSDWTQIEFRNADQRLLDYNTTMKELFQPTANLKVGAEYEFPSGNFRLRGGFAYMPSPYNGDPSNFAHKYATGGIGFIVENSVAFDIGYAYGWWDNFLVNYSQTPNEPTSSKVMETVSTNNVMTTISYRF